VNYTIAKVLSLSAVVCLLSLMLPAGSGRVHAEDASIVRATRVDGAVMKNSAPLKEGDVIQRDDKLETKANSGAVLTWSNGSMLEVYPDTAITLKGVIFESDRKLEKSLLALDKGRVFVKAQVPENIFCQFEISAGGATARTQGAEFAMKYDDAAKTSIFWSLLGAVIIETDTRKARVEGGQQATVKAGANPETPAPMSDKMKDSLLKTSKRLGGSLLVEEESASPGGPLSLKIGGVMNRRGNAPYTVKFKALTKGGSGKIKSIDWSFGDGESASGKEAQHTFTQGVYVVVVQIQDENGQKATAQINISVEENCGC